MFCVVFLGERVGIHRTSAVLVGLLVRLPRLVRRVAARLGHDVLVGVQGRRLVVLLHLTGRPARRVADRLAETTSARAAPTGPGPPVST